jgi:polyhydroxyalkanoate synthase subunit PhaC
MAPSLNPGDLIGRVTRDVERSVLRARNGIRYVRGTHRPKLGATPKDVVWRSGKAELWRYRGGPGVRYGPPVVIVHSLVSRSYILDLRPGNSTVEYLVNAGLEVFMLDWGVPDELDADNSLETYVDGYLPRALAAVRRETDCDEVTLAGYCLGGVIAALYAAGRDDARVRNLILMATPIDFGEMGAMVALLREGRLDPDDLIDDSGNVPADALYSGFYMLAPTTEIAQKATLLEHLWNDEFVEGFQAMAQWSRDHVPFPGAAFRQLVELLVRENALTSGSIRVGYREIALERARGDVLVAMAQRDNVVPAGATEPAMRLVGDPARREALRLPGGHVTFGTGKSAFKHTMPRLTEWITAHSDERPTTRRHHGDPADRAR